MNDKLDLLIENYLLNLIEKNKHPKYGNIVQRHRRGRGRGFIEPYLLKCIRKSKKVGISGCYYDENKNRYIFYSYHNQYFRNQANKAIRKLSNEDNLSNGSFYKKVYDYECMCW